MSYSREEVESAFRNYFLVGPVHEDWAAWSKLFVDDAVYFDHYWGRFRGPSEIQVWIESVMLAGRFVYSVLLWYSIDDDRVVYEVVNRADNPDPMAPPLGFNSIQVVDYAGEGRWAGEQDWWVLSELKEFASAYTRACRVHDPDHPTKMTRLDWGPIDWARPDPAHAACPSWIDRADVVPAIRPEDLRVGTRVKR